MILVIRILRYYNMNSENMYFPHKSQIEWDWDTMSSNPNITLDFVRNIT